VVKKGSYTTASNIAHLITNRVSYFYINSLLGAAALGVYSTAISLSEAILMASSSAGVVHYSNIVNSKDENQNQNQTILFAKYSLAITVFVFIIIYFIPNDFFTGLLGKDFTEVKHFILIFIPGIIALSITHIFTHYFSGIGNFRIPFFASLISCILVGSFAEYSLLQFQQSGLLMLTSIGLVFQAIILVLVFNLERKKYLQKKL
jgi:O-antigen/teichoic acid export membrane protein